MYRVNDITVQTSFFDNEEYDTYYEAENDIKDFCFNEDREEEDFEIVKL